MTEPENNSPTNAILKTLIPATILGGIAIGSFVLIYFSLESSVAPFPRLMLAICVPPALIAILIGFYMLFGPKRGTSD